MKERRHKYEVVLSGEQRLLLQQLLARGHASTRQQTHACVLLQLDRNAPGPLQTDKQVAETLKMSRYTVIRIRERFATRGLDGALNHRTYTHRARALNREQEAVLLTLSCSACPAGQERWTLRLLANRMVELDYVERISHETVRQVLKKNASSI